MSLGLEGCDYYQRSNNQTVDEFVMNTRKAFTALPAGGSDPNDPKVLLKT
jgi:hypothetical protein